MPKTPLLCCLRPLAWLEEVDGPANALSWSNENEVWV